MGAEIRYCVLIVLLLFSMVEGVARERYNFLNLSLGDGLSQINVTSICQDQKGFIWVGTRNGLNKYDGYTFEVLRNKTGDEKSLSDNHVLCLETDSGHYLWIGTNMGLNRLDLQTNVINRFVSDPNNDASLSHNVVPSICIDKEGNVWIGTNSGLNLYQEGDTFSRISAGGLFDNNPVNKIVAKDDLLFVATQKKGIVIYNYKTGDHSVLDAGNGLPENFIKTVYVNNNGDLWIGTRQNGVVVLKQQEGKPVVYNSKNGLTNDFIRCIEESPEGHMLVGTFNGLNSIDPVTGDVIRYRAEDPGQGSLSHYSIYSILFDNSRTLWVGTYAGGINYYNPYGQKFRFHNPYGSKTNRGIIGPMLEWGDCLYIASEGAGLIELNKETGKYSYYQLLDNLESAYGSNILKSIYLDNGRLLCGTNRGTIYSFDINAKKFSLFYDFRQEQSIYHISKNQRGDILIGGVNEIGFCMIGKDKTIRKFFPVKGQKDISFRDVRCVLEASPDVYLIGTRNNGLYHYDLKNESLSNYVNNGTGTTDKQINENYVSSIIKDSRKRFWVGTYGGGISLFDIETGDFRNYGTEQGLAEDIVCALVEGHNSHLWISTLSGISDFDTETGGFESYSHASGIGINEFTPHVGLKLSDNQIVFSGDNGFVTFNPRQMSFNPYVPPVVLKGLYINNKPVSPNTEDSPLHKLLDEQEKIVLKHNQSNNIAIEFCALNYVFPDRNQYSYMLEGFDEEWNEIGSRRAAYFTNIPPGDYKFMVRASNNDGVWNDLGRELLIIVLPPLWKTWWAYCLYLTVVLGVTFLIIRHLNQKRWLENEVKMKQAENKAQEEFYAVRNKLFTNFSHELRTPLTLILSPLEDILLHLDQFPDKVKKSLELMNDNGKRLLRLVNNLMDFQKKESGKLKLRVSEGDFIGFSGDMVYLFDEMANSRGINLEFRSNVGNLNYWFDKDLMERVFFNFLSNAFKNTPNYGSVVVSVNACSYADLLDFAPEKARLFGNEYIEYICLEIKDSGIGLDKDELDKIFIPFYQAAQNEYSSSGTGIGLSLNCSIVEMHHGTVWAESPEKKGAEFKVILPVDNNIFEEDEIIREAFGGTSLMLQTDEFKKNVTKPQVEGKRYTVLIVEDHPDVRGYIVSHLSDTYHTVEASNGKEALDKAFDLLPDLIISDLMMPKMSGMEMTSILKNDIRTSHIPVILLTARSMPQDMMEGYETGADDYITKPFNSQVMKSRVENILKARETLKEIYSRRFTLETLGIKTSSADDKFIQKLYRILEKELPNSQFNQDSLSMEIGMSKASLYRKIKAITNLSPSEFVRNYRLEMAAKLILEAQLPISDVYAVVGFNSHTYFSTCFKNLYGISPSEYSSGGK